MRKIQNQSAYPTSIKRNNKLIYSEQKSNFVIHTCEVHPDSIIIKSSQNGPLLHTHFTLQQTSIEHEQFVHQHSAVTELIVVGADWLLPQPVASNNIILRRKIMAKRKIEIPLATNARDTVVDPKFPSIDRSMIFLQHAHRCHFNSSLFVLRLVGRSVRFDQSFRLVRRNTGHNKSFRRIVITVVVCRSAAAGGKWARKHKKNV